MAFERKPLSQQLIICVIFCNLIIAFANPKDQLYKNLKVQTEITASIVQRAEKNLTTQLSLQDPLANATNKNWYFGVSACWNTSFNEEERLVDDYTRLKILRRYAAALNISKKGYVQENLALEISNLYRSIRQAKTALGYKQSVVVPKQVIGPFTAKTSAEKKLIDVYFLVTLQKNLLLMVQDFTQRISPTA